MRPAPDDPERSLFQFHRLRRDGRGVLLASSLLLPLVVMMLTLPPPVVLPAFSLWALGVAAILALIAIFRGIRSSSGSSGVNAWDLAGAFTLIGCAAAILGEIEHLLDFFKPLPSRSQAHD